MTREEISTKAIEKAVKNGFNPCDKKNGRIVFYPKTSSWWEVWDGEDEEGNPKVYDRPFCPKPFELIFSHDFAKAFWGKEEVAYADRIGLPYQPEWQYHLQQMVLEEDPIKYLEQFL